MTVRFHPYTLCVRTNLADSTVSYHVYALWSWRDHPEDDAEYITEVAADTEAQAKAVVHLMNHEYETQLFRS